MKRSLFILRNSKRIARAISAKSGKEFREAVLRIANPVKSKNYRYIPSDLRFAILAQLNPEKLYEQDLFELSRIVKRLPFSYLKSMQSRGMFWDLMTLPYFPHAMIKDVSEIPEKSLSLALMTEGLSLKVLLQLHMKDNSGIACRTIKSKLRKFDVKSLRGILSNQEYMSIIRLLAAD